MPEATQATTPPPELPNGAPASQSAPPAAPPAPESAAPSVDVTRLVTENAEMRNGLRGLKKQFETARTETEGFRKAVSAIKAGGDPEAVLAAAEAAGFDTKAMENYLVALAAKNETPEQKRQRDIDKRFAALEERDAALREREETAEAETVLGDLSKSLAEEIKANAQDFPLLAQMPEEVAADLVSRAAHWRAEKIKAGDEPSLEDFVAHVNELAKDDEATYLDAAVDVLTTIDPKIAQTNEPLQKAIARFVTDPKAAPNQKQPSGQEQAKPGAAGATSRGISGDLAGERGGAQPQDPDAVRKARALAVEDEFRQRRTARA